MYINFKNRIKILKNKQQKEWKNQDRKNRFDTYGNNAVNSSRRTNRRQTESASWRQDEINLSTSMKKLSNKNSISANKLAAAESNFRKLLNELKEKYNKMEDNLEIIRQKKLNPGISANFK